MRVAIDGKRYYLNNSGLGRYSRSLVDQLINFSDKENLEISLYRPKGRVKFEPKSHSNLTEITADYFFPGHIGNAIWRFTKLPSLINSSIFDLYHGPSHVLPTSGNARFDSGLSVLDFLKRTSYIEANKSGLKNTLHSIETLGNSEGLDAHVKSAKIRFSRD